ncbi:MAG: AI-2E family transporter [Lacrimispora celerecrescens]|uniref:AI-2E family transporter n=1 Tax=Lacrimispora indolis TaxID=69825 RepID=UPI0004296A2B|nr:AI-2E family transporter [Lacrimispora celerecrescens]
MEFNDSTIKKIRGLIVFAVIVVVAGWNYRSLFALAMRLIGFVSPFLLGGVMAFILNVPMRRIEKMLPVKEESRLRRPFSLCLTLVFVVGVLLLVIFVVMPQLFETILSLQNSIPAFLASVKEEAERLFAQNPEIADYINSIQIDWKAFLEGVVGFLSTGAGSVLSSTVSAAMSIINGVTTFVIALVFAIYILLQKETLSRQFQKLMKAFLPEAVMVRTLEILKLVSETFSNFLAGQCLEAVILGSMFFLTLSVFRLPYGLLIGVLIAFTALIPMFGAFIGCAIGAFLMLMVKPLDAVIFLIIFFVLQQVEGNFIYPHVVGNSVGLPSIWVLVAVTIGGSAMGIVGMLVFIPLCSVVYAILREIVNGRLEKKKPIKNKKI